ncbi:phage tail protein [Pseudoflavonifractor capillosus]|uniref:major tail protein n=1 Tax=Pseudoflavonifractor capillosus TaxID=106588 RepID=UPI001958259D|nr:major tail protein [Pseudoflavonifractor capillosus]MBM6897448.1 phage tail protein [Pseudoflavonifractor capillosus]
MAGTTDKVQFNLKNVHYAPMTATGATPAWGTPVKVPGAVSLSLDQQGELTKFYADGIVYWQSSSNNGYEGALEMALIPDQMLMDIWGYTKTETDNVLIENATVEPKAFALLFEIDGDVNGRRYCLYNCSGTRPGISSKTNESTKEPQPQSFTVSAVPLENGKVLARTTDETTSQVKNEWFSEVYEEAAG